ncbi:HAMP domain-containing sensor histidine kinase [Bacillus sp. 165]|uniref:ATP-binding protein n=1 Tax=Bacillus sp. 165 TaxID=1529117 RepID=UPI001AD975EF|nr:HAMP domain-containing histidine kinase [Bacillus sp. 165]
MSEKQTNVKIILIEKENYVVITVEDHGQGILKKHLAHVKKSFYQVNTKKEGTGLGLAISQNIISLHNGTLEIDSEINKGTILIITLPKQQ